MKLIYDAKGNEKQRIYSNGEFKEELDKDRLNGKLTAGTFILFFILLFVILLIKIPGGVC